MATLPCGTGLPGSLQAAAPPTSCRPAQHARNLLTTSGRSRAGRLQTRPPLPPAHRQLLMPHYPPRYRGVARTAPQPPAGPLFSLHTPRRAARALAALGEAGAPATAGPPPLPHPSINNPREIAAGVAHSRRRAGDLQAAPCGCAGRAHTSGAAGVRGLPGCEHTGSRAQQLDAGPKPQGRECPERAGLAARPDVPPWSKERARLPGTTKRGWRQTNSALHCGANPAAGAARRGGCNSRQRQQKLAARGRAGKCTQLSASPKRARGASTS